MCFTLPIWFWETEQEIYKVGYDWECLSRLSWNNCCFHKNMFYKAKIEIYGVHIIQNVQHTTFLQDDNLQKKRYAKINQLVKFIAILKTVFIKVSIKKC